MMKTTHADHLLKQSLNLIFNPLARAKYVHASEGLNQFLLKQEGFTRYLSEQTGLDEFEIKEYLHNSVSVMTAATLVGWDFGARFNRLEAFRGALVGGSIGLCLVIGQLTIKIVLNKAHDGFILESSRVEAVKHEAN